MSPSAAALQGAITELLGAAIQIGIGVVVLGFVFILVWSVVRGVLRS